MFARAEAPFVDLSVLEDSGDTELVQLMKLGNEDALGVLLRRHRDALYRFCLHLMADRDDAEDICQDTMTRAILRVDSLQSGAAFRSWLFSIARNLSIDSHRSRKRTCQLPDEEVVALPLPLHHESPYDRIELEEEHQTVAHALQRLKKNHQTVLMMREVEGLSYAEIADRLDVSQSAVETLLFRARRRLREEYGKSSTPAPAFALMPFLRGLLGRLLTPLSGAPLAAKVVVTAAVIGGAAITSPHVIPALSGGHNARAASTILAARTARLSISAPAAVPSRNPGLLAVVSNGATASHGGRHASPPALGARRHRAPNGGKLVPVVVGSSHGTRGHVQRGRTTPATSHRHHSSSTGGVIPGATPAGGAAPIGAPTATAHPDSGTAPVVGTGHNGSPAHRASVPTPVPGTSPQPGGTAAPVVAGSTAVPTRVDPKAGPTPLPPAAPTIVPANTPVALPANGVPTAVVGTVKTVATQVVGQVQQQATQVGGQVKQVATQVTGQVKQQATQVTTQVTQVSGQVKQQATHVAGGLPKLPLPIPTIPVHLPH